MLKQLTVANVGLVKQIDLALEPGLTVMTGESGAGKSLLLAALSLVLGDRAQSSVLRRGAERAEVSAEFDLSRYPQLQQALGEQGLDDHETPALCLLRRVATREGRSRAFINDTPITQAGLRALAGQLVDIHGQQEGYRLGSRDVQRELLDDYGCDAKDLAAARSSYRAWQTARVEHERLVQEQAANADRRQLITYQLEELTQLALQPGEFTDLEARFRRAAQAQHLAATVQDSLARLEDESLAGALRPLKALRDDRSTLTNAIDCLQSALSLVEDAAAELRSYLESLDSDSEAVAAMEERLSELHATARKHRVAPEALELHIEELQQELQRLGTAEADAGSALAASEAASATFYAVAKRLTQQRKRAAKRFAAAVSEHMQLLGIADGALQIAWRPQEGEHGAEGLEFLIVTNAGAEPAPLRQVASGGEQARISLAIAIVAAASTALPCLVLDEADVGVGGITADTVGRLLRRLAEHSQVICITHAPQVAALGHQHLRVFKDKAGTQIEILDAPARQEEVARMLAGSAVTDETRTYASTLLAGAD